MSGLPICEKLARTWKRDAYIATNRTAPPIKGEIEELVNPDGPEAADTLDALYEALVSAFNLIGTTTDCLNSGEPSRLRYAEHRIQREMDSIRAALAKARGQ